MIDWRTFVGRWMLSPAGASYLDTVATAVEGALTRISDAHLVLYPSAAPADALPYLALDRSVPTYTGEDEAFLRTRLNDWGTLLDEAGTLRLLARLAHLYHPTATKVVAVSRSQYMATSTSPTTTPVVAPCPAPWDWDSLDFTPLPPERVGDAWIIVHGGPEFSTGDITTLTDVGPLGFADSVPLDLFTALAFALSRYSCAITCIRTIVYVETNSQLSFETPASLPAGDYGRWRGRPTAHRYLESD